MSQSPGRQSVKIYPLPTSIQPGDLVGGVAVVIDVLRASTTIAVALASGAARIIPCGDLETARRLATEDSTGNTLCGGERQGVKIEGFDLDNSPLSYTRERVGGKTIAFTTTNGTAALLKTEGAARVLIGALVNRDAVADALGADGRPVHLICAGTDGVVTDEDVFCAGAIATALGGARSLEIADGFTRAAAEKAAAIISSPAQVLQLLRKSPGGANLVPLGFDQDIVRAAEVDSIRVVPEYSANTRDIAIQAGAGGLRPT
jgi:2-phosphosulfolactate phosphatase